MEGCFLLLVTTEWKNDLKHSLFCIFCRTCFVRLATRCPLTADIFVFCNVLDRLSVCENSRSPKFSPKKKSKVFIWAWHPIILPRTSACSFWSRQTIRAWRRAESFSLSMIRWKQLARTVHLVGQRLMTLPVAGCLSSFSFTSLNRRSRFGDWILWGLRLLLLCPLYL